MRPHWNGTAVGFTATFSQVSDQLLARVELSAGRLIAIEIANQADSERDVVQKVTVHMATVNLTTPSIANLDFTVAGRSAVSDHEVIGQTVLHAANAAMIIVKNTGIALSRAAVMHHDEFPTVARDRRAPDFFND